MQNGKVIFRNIESLTEKEQQALHAYENGTKKDFRKIFEDYFEEEYESLTKFRKALFQKAKGKSDITVSSEGDFVTALDKAFAESSIYDVEAYRAFKEQADEMFLHFGRTEKAQNMILDYIANETPIDSDAIMRANAEYFNNRMFNVNHGLYGFPGEIYSVKGPTDNPLQRIRSNIQDIISDSSIELSLSSYDYMVGPIGLSGTVNASVYHTNDIRSHVDWSTGKRLYQPNKDRAVGTIKDIIDSIERKSNLLFTRHDELIGSGFKPTALWVKEDFYSANKDYVHSLLKEFNIENLDLIHASENTEKIGFLDSERFKTKDIVDIPTSSTKKRQIVRGPKLKTKESPALVVENPSSVIEVSVPKAPSPKLETKTIKPSGLSNVKLSGKGIAAIAVGAVALGAVVAKSDKKPKKKKEEKKRNNDINTRNTNMSYDNTYAMQMAQDISSYRYGKHMTGFVNF